ncbi:sugar phosphate isomerase/epimerase family protein [Flavihumibacter profundi]|uniref:sugar phosphate isomerase/epimerase family protein n=1 Tax=Flavihumibacter profundi TaxID=2716883 RepID=UPI001CC3C2DA|nr:sugar phosphate isomerase/epimerase family protein [Flavihumibacter profundi]MBZ5856101.1 sugar phosphate isomerase/epimerase [Flavihumibacter profundi]
MANALPFRFGSEVYTWFMNGSGKTHENRLGHMMEIIARAGFTGIQPIHFWMGDLSDPGLLEAKLRETGLELAAISLALDWKGTEESEKERKEADQMISLLQRFPGAILCTVQIPSGRHELETRRRNLVNIVNTVSRRAMEKGVPCSFHPNSPHTSIVRTAEDYAVILPALDSAATGWTPDVGHIINAGMDPLEKMKEYSALINHMHYKDWNGEPEFTLMGNGKVDLIGITQWLKDINYKGWIICEDEGPEAMDDPDYVTLHDGRWVNETLVRALK